MFALIRYSEIALKKRKRAFFENLLLKNIKEALPHAKIWKIEGRICVETKESEEKVKNILERIFGVHSFVFPVKIKFKEKQEIIEKAFEYFKEKINGKKFKIECKRVGTHDFSSYDIKVELGEKLSKYGKVDVKNPDVICYVEIRNDLAFFYDKIFYGPGGLPIGSEGKVLALVSGGFDSSVASWFLMKRGAKVDIVHFNLGKELEEYYFLRVVKKLLEWSYGYKNKIFVVDFFDLMLKIMEKCKEKYWLIIFRKAMYEIAEKIALKIGAKGLVTGEAVGQKSSQTLENLFSAEYGLKIPILRPLIGFDKDEIIKMSIKIGTYEYSAEMPELCAILSIKPLTKSKFEKVAREWEKVKNEIKNVRIRVINKEKIDERIFELEKVRKEFENSLKTKIDESEFELKFFIGKTRVKGFENIEFKDVLPLFKKIQKNKKVLLACKRGVSAFILARELRKNGYKVFSASLKNLET